MGFRKHHEITLYTSPSSRYCDLAKGYFRDSNLDYTEIDVSKSEGDMGRMQELSGNAETPVVVIDGRVIPGFQPDIFDIILKPKEEEEKKDKAEE